MLKEIAQDKSEESFWRAVNESRKKNGGVDGTIENKEWMKQSKEQFELQEEQEASEEGEKENREGGEFNPPSNFPSSDVQGVMTMLTMTFLGLEARTDLPKVPYPTALDFFVFLSFAFIFATIIQFAVVHYFTKYGSGECYFGSETDDDDEISSDEDRPNPTEIRCNRSTVIRDRQQMQILRQNRRQQRNSSHRRKFQPRYNSVSKIDRASRLVFPLFFITINLFYWFGYLSRSQRIEYFS